MSIKAKKVFRSKRERAKIRIKKRLESSDRPRLSVFRSSKHIYAQLINDIEGGKTIVSASTLDKEVQGKIKDAGDSIKKKGAKKEDAKLALSTKSVAAAKAVGLVLAERAKSKDVKKVVFDRNGYIYHGRIEALADGAREGGLEL